MLESFRIQDFKCFKDTGPIEIRPITILLGLNSSGKSTILQALLALKQTVESRDDTTTLISDGQYVDLGTYTNFAHRHSRRAAVAFEWVTPWPDRLSEHPVFSELCAELSPWLEDIESITSRVVLSQNYKTGVIYPKEYSITSDSGRRILYVGCAPSGDPREFETDLALDHWHKRYRRDWLSRENFHFTLFERPLSPPEYFSQEEHSTAIREAYHGHWISARCDFLTSSTFEGFLYMGPLRERPRRLNLIGGETPPDVGLRGENTVNMMLARRQTGQWVSLRKDIQRWFDAFGIAKDVRVERVGTGVVTIQLKDPRLEIESSLADIGFGASQVLPVIVQGLCAADDALLLVEQPEIHLHPDAQAELGDFFIETSGEGKRWLIETHSEHLLLRVQRRIAEDKLRPQDVAVYYVERKRGESHVRRIELDEYGRMPEWPRDFFAADFEDVERRVIEAAKKSRKKGGDCG